MKSRSARNARILASLLTVSVAACTRGTAKDVPPHDTEALSARAGDSRAVVARELPRARQLENGTPVFATTETRLSSLTNHTGELVRATVSSDIRDVNGAVVIPVGSLVVLTVAQLQSAGAPGYPNGEVQLAVYSLAVDAQEYPVSADMPQVPFHLEPRHASPPRTAALAGDTDQARNATWRDVIVPAGTQITFVLTQPFSVVRDKKPLSSF